MFEFATGPLFVCECPYCDVGSPLQSVYTACKFGVSALILVVWFLQRNVIMYLVLNWEPRLLHRVSCRSTREADSVYIYWWILLGLLWSRLWTTVIRKVSCTEMWSPTMWWLTMNKGSWGWLIGVWPNFITLQKSTMSVLPLGQHFDGLLPYLMDADLWDELEHPARVPV